MSERRPDPPDPRASLVDSGWSEVPAPTKERDLPSYDDGGRDHLVTRVDDQIQARIAAMNDEATSTADGTVPLPSFEAVPSPPPPPPPPPPLPMPRAPSRPPPPVTQRAPSRPPPPVTQRAVPSRPPPPSSRAHSRPPPPVMPAPPAPLPELSAVPIEEATMVDAAPEPVSTVPPSLPPLPMPPAFKPLPSSVAPPAYGLTPTLGEALADQVRIGGAELPLWGVLAPTIALTALVSALIAGWMTPTGSAAGSKGREAATTGSSSASAPSVTAPPPDVDATPSPATGSLVDRARHGDPKALGTIEHQRPEDRGAEEALALAAGKVAQSVAEATKLRQRLSSDPGLAKDPKIIADLRRFGQDPDTYREALAAMAALPGALSADLLYEAWTSTAERSGITELAQALLLGKDVRPKASPALAVAIDLRDAESCEANQKLLQRAIDVGDKRAFAPLARLLRHNGCGPTKRDDCFACLREGDQLKTALTAVKLRREPELVRRDNR
jgi:hypothetical protein